MYGIQMENPNLIALDEHTAAHVAELFRAFSDTSRVRILSVLTTQELNVSILATAVGISESAVSHHLRGLRQMHIVTARRDIVVRAAPFTCMVANQDRIWASSRVSTFATFNSSKCWKKLSRSPK